MRKTIAAAAAVLAIGAAIPLVASAGHDRHRGPQGDGPHAMAGGHHGMKGHHKRMRHGGVRGKLRMTELIETYDADGDGAVTQAEVDQWRANRLSEFDADGNGQLSLDEYEQLWLDAMRERMVNQFQRHDDDGDGQVTVEEFGERTGRMVMRMDRNEDDTLNMDDLRRGRHQNRGPRGDAPAGAPETPAGEQQGIEPQGTEQQ